MRNIKRCIALLVSIILCIILVGCNSRDNIKENDKKYQLTIMTTIFPYYDFTRAIVGDDKDIKVELLMSPGQDSHSYEPTPADVIKIDSADMFIYNGGSIEKWVDQVIYSMENKSQVQMKMMDYVEVLQEDHANADEIYAEDHHHEEEENDHEEGEEHNTEIEGEEHNIEQHDHEEDTDDDHNVELDEHIWTSPAYAITLTEKICDKLCELMPEKEKKFKQNAGDYVKQLKHIDNQFRKIVNNAEHKEIIFADKFPLKYFATEYTLNYYAAFPGCSGDTEPSARTVAFLIDKVKKHDVKGIFYLELSSQAMADVICDDTGAEKYQFNSCHNITQNQFDNNVTYIDLMQENVSVLKKALN